MNERTLRVVSVLLGLAVAVPLFCWAYYAEPYIVWWTVALGVMWSLGVGTMFGGLLWSVLTKEESAESPLEDALERIEKLERSIKVLDRWDDLEEEKRKEYEEMEEEMFKMNDNSCAIKEVVDESALYDPANSFDDYDVGPYNGLCDPEEVVNESVLDDECKKCGGCGCDECDPWHEETARVMGQLISTSAERLKKQQERVKTIERLGNEPEEQGRICRLLQVRLDSLLGHMKDIAEEDCSCAAPYLENCPSCRAQIAMEEDAARTPRSRTSSTSNNDAENEEVYQRLVKRLERHAVARRKHLMGKRK